MQLTTPVTASPSRPYVIAVANRKGGTGKTTSAVNVASALARRGKRTLLVDFDSQGHAGMALGVVAQPGEQTAHGIFARGANVLPDAIRVIDGGGDAPDLAPADTRAPHPGSDVPPDLLARGLEAVFARRPYDVVVIDTPPSLDALMVTALAAADAVLVPFVPHPLAIEGVRQFSRVFFSVRLGSGSRLRNLALVPVMANPHVLVHRRMIETLRRDFGDDRLLPSIRVDIRLAEAFGVGRTIFGHAPSSRGAQDYEILCGTLVERWLPSDDCQARGPARECDSDAE